MIGFTILGVKEIGVNLDGLTKTKQAAIRTHLKAWGKKVLDEAEQECPLDTGLLRASKRLSGPDLRGNKIEMDLSFETPYAAYVHEKMGVNHPVGKAKFLIDPVNRNMMALARTLSEAFK